MEMKRDTGEAREQEAKRGKRDGERANENGGNRRGGMISGRMYAEVRSSDNSAMVSGLKERQEGRGGAERAGRMSFQPLSTHASGFHGLAWDGGETERGRERGDCAPVEMVKETVFTTDNHDVSRVLHSFPSLHCANRIRELIMLLKVFGFERFPYDDRIRSDIVSENNFHVSLAATQGEGEREGAGRERFVTGEIIVLGVSYLCFRYLFALSSSFNLTRRLNLLS